MKKILFDEHALRREIEGHWGAHGAHAEVYRMLLKDSARYRYLRKQAAVIGEPPRVEVAQAFPADPASVSPLSDAEQLDRGVDDRLYATPLPE